MFAGRWPSLRLPPRQTAPALSSAPDRSHYNSIRLPAPQVHHAEQKPVPRACAATAAAPQRPRVVHSLTNGPGPVALSNWHALPRSRPKPPAAKRFHIDAAFRPSAGGGASGACVAPRTPTQLARQNPTLMDVTRRQYWVVKPDRAPQASSRMLCC